MHPQHPFPILPDPTTVSSSSTLTAAGTYALTFQIQMVTATSTAFILLQHSNYRLFQGDKPSLSMRTHEQLETKNPGNLCGSLKNGPTHY